MREDIISVGIDIGTSTTQLIFSKISIENLASSFSVPRITIVGKEIIYRSDIYFTPLIGEKNIDIDKVMEIIEGEYRKSGINKEDIKVGAVIITGETARKQNASEVLEKLSGYAGDFVVATAGPDLESIISGKGAGADVYAKEHNKVVVNIDIGGGTSNLAAFNRGDVISTGCLDIGGRLVKIDKSSNTIYYIYEKIKKLIAHYGFDIKVGEAPKVHEIEKLCDKMAEILEMSVGIRDKDEFYNLLLTNDKDFSIGEKVDAVSFSGGVADYIYNDAKDNDDFKFGDIGIILGRRIKNSKLVKGLETFVSRETIRATVVGAGSHTTEISGSTISYAEDKLPIKNIAILKLTEEDIATENSTTESLRQKLEWFRLEGELQNIAIGFKGKRSMSFNELEGLARGIINGAKEILDRKFPLVIIVETDVAKALGQTITRMLDYKESVICVDGIQVENGDYVDIGMPLAEGKVVPVVIKTLVFNK